MWPAHPRLGGAARGFVGYLREVSGETAYERYVEHRRREHPGDPVMSRRDYERWRMDQRDENPGARCC
jgi:uncharacterized short protein YbdD (DUF466 family)